MAARAGFQSGRIAGREIDEDARREAARLALLAALPDDEAGAVIAQHGDALSSYGRLDGATLRLLVNASRERGWAIIGNHGAKGRSGSASRFATGAANRWPR